MKLNYKRVILVGMAFFLIMAFWQAYDAIVPLILTNHFGLPQTASGAIMAIDNVLAVFLLPIFGTLSDKLNTKWGKRTPFILIGTLVAVVAFIVLTFVDNYQLAAVTGAGIPELTMEGATEEALTALRVERALELTLANPLPLVGFIVTLLVVLLAMAVFRSPAVALMPDVTIKPLRSKANAVINITGTAGGILVLVLGMVFATSKNLYMRYTGYVAAVIGIMLLGLIVFLLFVKEKQWAKEMEDDSLALGLEEAPAEEISADARKLSKPELRSLLLILASVALWYIGYNSITSKYSVYVANHLPGFDFNFTLIIAQAAAIVSYIPVGFISQKFGRRKTILVGVAMLATAFGIGHFITVQTPEPLMYAVFALAGIGWATINVNSFPMVVELARGGNVGKYTGYYYTASMAAQIVAPVLSGLLYDLAGSMRPVFFIFGTVFVALSFVTMFFVKHGDAQVIEKKSALEHLDVD